MVENKSISEMMTRDEARDKHYRKRKRELVFQTFKKDDLPAGAEWEVEKGYKTSVRMWRRKNVEETVRDNIWCLFYELGIPEIASLPIKLNLSYDEPATYELDILAVDEELILAVVCRTQDKLGNYAQLETDVTTFRENQNAIRKILRKEYPGKRKILFVLATKNIHLEEGVRDFVERNKIVLFDENDVMKLKQLAGVAGEAAKYQVYNRILHGSKIKGVGVPVPAIRSKMGGKLYYAFVVSPERLLKMAYVHQRATQCTFLQLSDSYQRILKKSRVKSITQYIDQGGYFPGSIILNFPDRKRTIKEVGHLPKKKQGQRVSKLAVPVTIELPQYYGCAWVIDGQHRLYGYAETPKKKTETLPVVAFVKQPSSEQARIFLDINYYQRKIEADLIWDLYEDLYRDSTVEKEKKLYRISMVGKKLNEEGALKNRIKIPKSEPTLPATAIGLDTVCKCIERNNFLNKSDDPFYDEDTDTSIANCAQQLKTFLEMIASSLPVEWDQGKEHFVCTTGGIAVLINIFSDILPSLDLDLDKPDLFKDELRPFASALAQHIKLLPDSKIKEYREASVGRAQTPQVQADLTRAIIKAQPFHSRFLREHEGKESEFEKYSKLDEGDTLEMKGSLMLNVKGFLKRKREKVTSKEIAKSGVLKSIVAFLNAEDIKGPSTIVVGVLEREHFPDAGLEAFGEKYLQFGIDVEYSDNGWDGYERKLQNLISDHISKEAFSLVDISRVEYRNRNYCVIKIPKGDKRPDKWYYLDDKEFYVRSGGQTRELTGVHADEYRRLHRRRS